MEVSEISCQILNRCKGIQMGLWLTINLEQYENVKWYGEEAGVKVSLASCLMMKMLLRKFVYR